MVLFGFMSWNIDIFYRTPKDYTKNIDLLKLMKNFHLNLTADLDQ